MNRLILLVESRIRGDVYVRFGGELPKTHRSNTAGRWMLSLPLDGQEVFYSDKPKRIRISGKRHKELVIGITKLDTPQRVLTIE